MRKLLPTALTLAGGALLWTTVPAGAGPGVDPSTLQPAPPPGAECNANGPWTICHTRFDASDENEPIDLGLPCGTVYETLVDVRDGIRWYLDGKLVKRFVSQNAEGTWRLAPGTGPAVTIVMQANWRNEYAIPGDESSGPMTVHGDGFTARAPGYGVIAHIAGLDLPDGTHRGVLRLTDDPKVAAEICAAVGA